ncbi:sigma-70 family RNA polymerase sigma factor [Alkalimonas sp.]|uniref:sigma-70 family RNA polymerase sigma factor n=1 Tax=Alkalimonas sp. TaxID=1872453 RepID=UPI00263BCB1E|nr:sigma-70 family RNA polymerase sigma factor [Alkalimonas sp.]
MLSIPLSWAGTLCPDQLMQHYQKTGASKWLDGLIQHCGDDLYHFLLRQSDPALAQDICQQTWLKVMEKRHSFRADSRFKTWLFSMARNALLDELKRQQRWLSSTCPEQLAQPEVECSQSWPVARQQRFEQALRLLPFLQREALMLQLEGFSVGQIASITNELDETVKSRLRYARRFLQARLGEHDE